MRSRSQFEVDSVILPAMRNAFSPPHSFRFSVHAFERSNMRAIPKAAAGLFAAGVFILAALAKNEDKPPAEEVKLPEM